jgi:hypothetical protein
MNRKRFVEIFSAYTGAIAAIPLSGFPEFENRVHKYVRSPDGLRRTGPHSFIAISVIL